uniref:UBA domain-containing protein n=2 Tax=Clastoptera arizonana TaxID=38151 RepID=A0A1B6DNP8_9HEMI
MIKCILWYVIINNSNFFVMSQNLKFDNILSRIREQLNLNKIKLWLPPYADTTTVESHTDEGLCALAVKYSSLLNFDKEMCLTALKQLQKHSLDRVKEKEVFKETGLATIKIKVSSRISQILSLQIHLSDMAEKLIQKVSDLLCIPKERIKLVANGKVLNDKLDLFTQGVKNGMNIMAMLLAEKPQELIEHEKRVNAVEGTKEDLALLTSGSSSYLQLEDQSGRRLNLPEAERNALVTAMALHEKGRAALKREDYSLALVNYLEADEKFSTCTSELLKCVDNYALLHLDIAWCYLCLGNVSQIPDAEKRLKECENKFHQSYGTNMERLLAIKGSTGNEAVLFLRLHLLQGIVYYHTNKSVEARELLRRTEDELKCLKVDDASLCALFELGFTQIEARIGLRATKGNLNAAADYIHKRRQERAEMKKKNLEQEKLEKEKRRLGLCADGVHYVEPRFVNQLVDMGFAYYKVVAALQKSNNNIGTALQLIQEQPHLLQIPNLKQKVDKVFITQVTAMGFDPRMAKVALQRNNLDIDRAVAELLACGGNIEDIDCKLCILA